ncbi:MAG: DUF2325 domain-containing protein [Labilithrix sp.]|nr:DUF2325 domain-containing protein [Labilithrix sp.]
MSANRARSSEPRDDASGVLPSSRTLRVLVVGGLTRLDAHYRAAPAGIEIDTVNADCGSLETRAGAADAIVLVVGNVSHAAAAKVRSIARRRGTPLASTTGASVSRVRASIALAFVAARDGEGLGLEPSLRLA